MNKILLSTTNTLEGWEIEKYFGTISANAVIGANVLSDFAASWTDFFGGRSGSYEKRLQQIYQQALLTLEARALDIGANCVVGLHIDIDEISGKGSQMFMITTYGTAVKANRTTAADADTTALKSSTDSAINNQVRMLKIKKRAERGKRIINYVDDIIENSAWEMAEHVLDDLKRSIPPPGAISDGSIGNRFNATLALFASMPGNKASEILYSRIVPDSDMQMTSYLAQIIKKLNLIDYARLPSMITSQNRQLIVEAMQILTGLKQSYPPDDSERIKHVLSIIDENILPREVKTKKGLLSSTEREVWKCYCGTTNETGKEYCECGRDMYGYTKNEFRLQDVKEHLGFVLSSLSNQQQVSKVAMNG